MEVEQESVKNYLESFEHLGIYIIDRKTMEVYFENSTARKYTIKDRIGQPCYLVHGNTSMCASCPLRNKERRSIVNRADLGMVFAVTARETMWQGRETYTITVEKERDLPKRKSLSEESLDRMNRALHASIISYVDINMATGMCQAIHFAEDGNHQVYDLPYESYMRDICFEQYVYEDDRHRGEEILGMEHLQQLSADSEGAAETKIRFRVKGRSGQEQFLESTAYILRDELPHHVSIIAKEVTEEEHSRVQLSLYHKMISNAVTTYEMNLTQNTFENIVGASVITDNVMQELHKCQNIDEFYQFVIRYTVGAEEQAKARRFFDRQEQLRLFAKGKSIVRERLPIDMDDGTCMWLDITCTMLQNPISKDIEAILYSEAVDNNVISDNMLNQMIRNDYDYLALFDLHHHTNKVFTNSLEYPKEEMENHLSQENREAYLRKIYAGDDVETFLYHNSVSYIHKRLATQETFDNFYYVHNEDGTISYKKETLSYLNGDRRYLLLSRTDNTDAVRTQEETNRKLQEALNKARKATEERTELFARMSHDMRTPMNGILGMTALSKDETDVAVLKQNMTRIDASAKYMLRMVNDTLDMKRIETGKLVLKPVIMQSHKFMENIEKMVRPSVEEAKLDLKVNFHDVDLDHYARFDAIRLEQIITNLISNSIKYTPEGGCIELAMSCLGVDGVTQHDVFSVRDTGIGMSREFVKTQLFTPYAQENNQLTGKYAGPGLGLAITKSLVELMGGRIEVKSELGEGTLFRVYLDIERVEEIEAQQRQNQESLTLQRAKETLGHKKILLCEDHPLNAEISKKLLKHVGCEVVWAEDGACGVELYRASDPDTFDAVLMDIRMPKMDGIEAARTIRLLPRPDAKTVPIIAMTANAFAEDIEASRNAGMNEHLAKPVVPTVLYETLERYLG